MIAALRGEVLAFGDLALARSLLGFESELLEADNPDGAAVVDLRSRTR
ncbi:MAG: hypothetical protein U0414_42550 [Polyangiaceae bacterium]